MATDFIFSYGSDMNRSELRSWLEGAGHYSSLIVETTPAVLEGYDFVWNYYSRGKGGGTANLQRKEGSTIWGVLIELDESLLKAFDRKEGHPYFYSRGSEKVEVTRVRDGVKVLAWLYLANPNKSASLDMRPTRQYKNSILNAAKFWEFPEEYVEKIRSWDAQ
ncbi:MAG: gamma-glutamylcyclotransferase [Deltaproteobacteria bacterium]|nr:gamma-glutamylcyclotransferase [Deltaproteobacteria bacterium]